MDKWLSHPNAVRLISLALGILLWAVVHFNPDSTPNNVASLIETRTFTDVKVQVRGLDEQSYVLKSMDPTKVKLIVRGTPSDLLAARSDGGYIVEADLSTVKAGTHTITLRTDLPRSIQTIQVEPATVTVELEELQSKEFEVQVTPKGTPKEGYKAGAPVLRPTNRVHVTLPASEMDRVDHVGGSISIEGADKTLKDKSVKLVAYDGSGQEIPGAEVDPAVLEVEVPITNPFKQVPIQLKLIGQLPAGLSVANLSPSAEEATIYGPQTELDKIDFIEADLNLSEVTKSGKVDITLSKSDAVTEVSPATISVDVQVVLTQTRTIQGLPITVKGLGNGLKMQITKPVSGQADITFKGAPAVLDKLQPGDVSVEADLSGRGPGTYTIPLNVNSPRFVDQSGGNTSIEVEITNIGTEVTPPPSAQTTDEPASVGVIEPEGGESTGTGTDTGNAGETDGESPTPSPSQGPTPSATPSSSPSSSPSPTEGD
ncbi:CdaR family protein [Cohnella sp. GbtcB17]|uniref:CdaR family protein n=1 Tax=Cohnella sp. GbtcB17 TaxID=2824762 RepID=UPI001C2F8E1C|nr:CdaR family protein [Cohnella sp. GbtcB17]